MSGCRLCQRCGSLRWKGVSKERKITLPAETDLLLILPSSPESFSLTADTLLITLLPPSKPSVSCSSPTVLDGCRERKHLQKHPPQEGEDNKTRESQASGCSLSSEGTETAPPARASGTRRAWKPHYGPTTPHHPLTGAGNGDFSGEAGAEVTVKQPHAEGKGLALT